MDFITSFLVLVGLGLLALPLALHLWHLRSSRRTRERLDTLTRRVATLESRSVGSAPSPGVPPAVVPPRAAAAAVPTMPPSAPGLPVAPVPALAPKLEIATAPRLNLENAIGVKLFAWMGGLALFVGVLLAVAYAFENNLITPGMRIIGGAVVGIALIAGGLFAAGRHFRAPAFSMCATGVLVLYGDIYAAHAYYNLLPLSLATVLMSAVSAGAFLLALRLDAQVIVVLGILGGFLTPSILWTGANKPLQLFGYAAVLNIGVAAIAIRKRWDVLILLAALGTIITELAWFVQFYDRGTASLSRFVFLFFGLQFLAICFARQRLEPAENWSALATGAAFAAGLFGAFCFVFAKDAQIQSAAFIFPFLFLCNAGVMALAIGRQFALGGMSRDWIAGTALIATSIVQWIWLDERFSPSAAFTPLLWFVAILALFVAYPYFSGPTAKLPWTIAAVAGVLQFWLVHRICANTYPTHAMGLLPLTFALPFAAGVWFLTRHRGVPLNSSDARIASQAAAALAFISLVFPVQFRGEWITIGWAIEGVALLRLYRLMPNARLQVTAIIVLCAAFGRLAFNPAVLEYHPRTGVPIFNWYLYAYGVTALCLLAAGRLLHRMQGPPWVTRSSRLLYALGVMTAFLLLNIEIADYFSIGPTLTFSFSGNFARDMTYSIAWALFALALLLIGMRQKAKAVRYAGLLLLMLTLAKLFLYDLGTLNQLYRIGAFIGVALILIVASFVYQRFLQPSAEHPRT